MHILTRLSVESHEVMGPTVMLSALGIGRVHDISASMCFLKFSPSSTPFEHLGARRKGRRKLALTHPGHE